jgi:hypothetical protein
MLATHSRSILLAGLLAAAMYAPAWSADDGAANSAPAGADLPLAMATSPPQQPGPVVARESLATEASAHATVVEGESQPTRSYANPSVGRRYAGKRSRISGGGASVAYAKPVYRHSLLLGIGY